MDFRKVKNRKYIRDLFPWQETLGTRLQHSILDTTLLLSWILTFPKKKKIFFCFNDSPSKMMKNAFHLKSSFCYQDI